MHFKAIFGSVLIEVSVGVVIVSRRLGVKQTVIGMG